MPPFPNLPGGWQRWLERFVPAEAVRRLGHARELAERLRAARHGRLLLDAAYLRARFLDASGASSLLLEPARGGMRLAAEWRDGETCRIEMREPRAVFAAGGAKEFSVRVRLVEGNAKGAERLVAALASAVAAGLWPWIGRAGEPHEGVVERDTSDSECYRVDLLSLPAVRRWSARRGRGLFEALSPRELRFEPKGLVMSVGLPWAQSESAGTR